MTLFGPVAGPDDLPHAEMKSEVALDAVVRRRWRRRWLGNLQRLLPDFGRCICKRDSGAGAGPNIEFTGFLPRRDYIAVVAQARAFVFAGCEDFGIALAEAQACGTPLIAFGRGGATDIVRALGSTKRPTGVLFPIQSAASVRDAVEKFELNRDQISPLACRQNAARFSVERFRDEVAKSCVRALSGEPRSQSN